MSQSRYLSFLLSFGGLFVAILYSILKRPRKPLLPDLPRPAFSEDEWFASLRSKWRCWTDFRSSLSEGYEKFSKLGLSFLFQTPIEAFIVLPPSTAAWIINQPHNVLDHDEPHFDSLQVDHAFPNVRVVRDPTHNHTVTVDLTRQVGSLSEAIRDEIETALDDLWGRDSLHWKEVCFWDEVTEIIAKTTNRAFVGYPLCREPQVWRNGLAFAADVPLSANILRSLPIIISAVLAPVITAPNRYHGYRFNKALKSEIIRRMNAIISHRAEINTTDKKEAEQNDFLQWTIHLALESPPGHPNRNPDIIASRVLAMNFAAIHTTSVGATNLMMDLLSSDSVQHHVDDLRKEVASVLSHEPDHRWSRKALSKMEKMDSTLRESHRINTFNNLALKRYVSAPEGITAPNGTFLPHRSMICVPAYGVHNDPDIYRNPDQFLPWRFAEMREKLDNTTTGIPADTPASVDSTTKTNLARANLSFITTSPTYLPFGHGRHACLGRFFASAELKILLATIFTLYDVELVDPKRDIEGKIVRPKNIWIGDLVAPPVRARVRVRRRVEGG